MKMIIVFAALFAAVLASPVDDSKDAIILRNDSDNIGVGEYNFDVATSDGKSHQEQGRVVDAGTEDEGIEVTGQYSYTGPDGVVYTVTYTAGKAGFVPSGDHIPKDN